MNVKKLIIELQRTLDCGNGGAEVFIETDKGMSSFSGISFDDVGDVSLYRIAGDKLA